VPAEVGLLTGLPRAGVLAREHDCCAQAMGDSSGGIKNWGLPCKPLEDAGVDIGENCGDAMK
jgi:hypothetical protein